MPISDNVPNFKWKSSREDFAQLEIDFGDDSNPDLALLKGEQDTFTEEFESNNDENECILTGYLFDQPDIPITVIGCPFNENFQVNYNICNLIIPTT